MILMLSRGAGEETVQEYEVPLKCSCDSGKCKADTMAVMVRAGQFGFIVNTFCEGHHKSMFQEVDSGEKG